MKKKEILIFVLLIASVILIIFLINYVKANGNHDDKTMQCIAEKSKVIVSPTCSWCAKQEQDLGEHANYFEFIDISKNLEILQQYEIRGTPSWIINQKVHAGYQTIEELKKLTGC